MRVHTTFYSHPERALPNDSQLSSYTSNPDKEREILTSALAHIAAVSTSTTGYEHANTAIKHFLSARSPVFSSIRSAIAKGVRHNVPPSSVRSTIPNIHKLLDKIVPLYNSTSQKDLRAHLAILLLLGSSRRLNDLVSIHRHQDSLRFNITALDVPSWASSCSTPRQSYIAWLQDMHLLENRDIKNTEFITLSF